MGLTIMISLPIIRMKAQEFANLRKASFNHYKSHEPFKAWMLGRHFILEGLAHDTKVEGEKEEKWSSGLNVEQRG
jgi:hypothetical protein